MIQRWVAGVVQAPATFRQFWVISVRLGARKTLASVRDRQRAGAANAKE
jgi:hypothetical protein